MSKVDVRSVIEQIFLPSKPAEVGPVLTHVYTGPKPTPVVAEAREVPKWTGSPSYIFPGVHMTDIANALGMTTGGVSRIFNGMRKPRMYVLKSIANLYTDGDVSKVKAVIRTRVVTALRHRKDLSIDERNAILARIQ